MRCAHCHSYVPQGLPKPIMCPQCGHAVAATVAEEPSFSAAAPSESLKVSPLAEQSFEAKVPSSAHADAFAPFFTLHLRLSLGLPELSPVRSEGTVSFGPEGLSFVLEQGRRWEKILYRDLSAVRVIGDSVQLTIRGVESRLVIFHPWLPSWISSARRERAEAFAELLAKVKRGLTPIEIELYQRRLS